MYIITEKQRLNFQPTWLYIKQHNVTGLKYFGKTVVKEPTKYKGSGLRWNNHLKIHTNNVTTTWYELFTDINKLVEYATTFSINNNIATSDEWANLIIENGVDGGGSPSTETRAKMSAAMKGRKLSDVVIAARVGRTITEKTRQRMSLAQTGRTVSIEAKEKIRKANLGSTKSNETKAKMSESQKKIVGYSITCPHCLLVGSSRGGNMVKYHLDNCKHKKV